MRRPLTALALLVAVAACSPSPVAPPVTASPQPSQAPGGATPSATPSVAETAAPTASPTLPPSPAPSATASPSPSPSPSGTPGPLGEAAHGDTPFPSPPADSRRVDLTRAVGAGQASAHGAIDGQLYTEWAARSGIGPSVWLAIDLGAERAVGKLDLLADASPEVDCFFNVELSDDGEAWRTVAAGKATGSNDVPVWGTATFPAETTRWVRVVPTSWGTSWVGIWEIRLRE